MYVVRKYKNMYNELYGIKITNKAVKCLGIYIATIRKNATLKIGWKYITILRNF